jgi:hypothetical protein
LPVHHVFHSNIINLFIRGLAFGESLWLIMGLPTS